EDAEQPRTQLGHAEQTRVLEFDHRRPTGFAPTPAQSSEAILPPNKERRRDRVSDLLTKDIRAIHAAACLLRKKLLRLLLATKGGGTTRGRDSGPAAVDRFPPGSSTRGSLAMTALFAAGLGVTGGTESRRKLLKSLVSGADTTGPSPRRPGLREQPAGPKAPAQDRRPTLVATGSPRFARDDDRRGAGPGRCGIEAGRKPLQNLDPGAGTAPRSHRGRKQQRRHAGATVPAGPGFRAFF
ncbi:hypothetical protein DFR50_122114, partial [Roseiarcus fermentans]